MDKNSARQQLLDQALTLAPFDGWNDAMLKQAAEQANLTPSELTRICPGGAIDLIAFWVEFADAEMEAFAKEKDLSALKIRDRIKTLVLFRIEHFAEHREAIRKACLTLASPWHAATNLRLLQQTVDRMWRLAGDSSNDYNWYSKRILLSGVYSSTLMYWLNDESDDFVDTKAFLDRRIENVMTVGKWIATTFKNKAA